MPALREGTSISTTGSGTSASLTASTPSGALFNDLLLVWCYSGKTGRTWSPGPDPNWTASTAVSGPNNSGQLFTASVDATLIQKQFTVTMSEAGQWGVVVLAISSPQVPPYDPSAPPNSGTAGTGTVVPGGTLVTGQAGDLLLWFGGVQAAAGIAPGVIGVPPGFTAVAGQANASGAAERTVGLIAAQVMQASAGSTGAVAGSTSTASASMGLLVAVAGFAEVGDDDFFNGHDAGEHLGFIQPGAPTQAMPGATWISYFRPWQTSKVPPPQSVSPQQTLSSGDTGSGGDSTVVAVSSSDVSTKPAGGGGGGSANAVSDIDGFSGQDGKSGGVTAKTSADTLALRDGK